MTADEVMVGVGLIVVLAVGSQLLASRLRIPALLVLLPVGFAAGALTDDVNPEKLLGEAFSPLVSLAVAVILYEAWLGLEISRLRGHTRRIVVRLLWLGALITQAVGDKRAVHGVERGEPAGVLRGEETPPWVSAAVRRPTLCCRSTGRRPAGESNLGGGEPVDDTPRGDLCGGLQVAGIGP